MAVGLSFKFHFLCLAITVSIVFTCIFTAKACEQTFSIEEEPSSLLIPVNETATFTCKAACTSSLECRSTGHWVINESSYSPSPYDILLPPLYGNFSIAKTAVANISYYTLSLHIYASEDTNNTDIFCVYAGMGHHDNSCTNRSDFVKLLVIADSPISPNPMTVENSPHLTLLWSPPFLWPGHRIQLYNVSFAIDGGINTYLVKSSYTSEMVSLTVEIYQNVCGSNYAFVITPMGTQMLPQSIEVSGTTTLSGRLCNKQSYDMPSNPTTNLGVVEGTSSYEILLYQVSMIVGLALACMFFVLLVIVISCVCFCHRKKQKEKKTREVKNNIYKTMILNPLYDVNGSKQAELGPVYECIKPSEPDSSYSTVTIPSTRNDVSNSVMSSLAGTGPDYRNGPRTLKVKNQIAQSFYDQLEPVGKARPTDLLPKVPNSVTVAAAPKKSGKERNKLRLTLTLTETDSVNPAIPRNHENDVPEHTRTCSRTQKSTEAANNLPQDLSGRTIACGSSADCYDV